MLLTPLGPVTLRRTYRRCGACEAGVLPADEALGLGGSLTDRACRLATLFGVEESFAQASRLLRDSVGWSLAPETIRHLCHSEATRLRCDRAVRLATADCFETAPGD